MLENEEKPVEEPVASAEETAAATEPQAADENKSAESAETPPAGDASVDKPAESVDQPKSAEGEKKPEEGDKTEDITEKLEDSGEGSDTAIDSDSDFDEMEKIDPSYAIDASLWKKVADFDGCDLKPAKKEEPEGAAPKEDKKKKVEEEVPEGEEDSGFSEIVIRSEKDRDQEFQEYIRELCRPNIVSYFPDRVAPLGSNVRLTCTVQGNNIQTKWMKDENVLERGKRIQTRTDGEIYTLEISEITAKDAGVYTAEFKNRAGEVATSSKVTVYDGKLHKPDHIDIALVKGELKFRAISIFKPSR